MRPVAALDAGFSDDLVTGVASPTALAFTPDGRLLITTQPGQLRVYQGGALVATPAIDLAATRSICTNSERGLLGVAVDPNFASNHFIYLYYTVKTGSGCAGVAAANRVSRFTLSDSNSAGSELILIDNIPNPGGNHNGGELGFGKDGYLYVGVGDGGSTPETAQQLNILTGKILRITTSGGIPPTNPYSGDPAGVRCNRPAARPARASARRSTPTACAIPSGSLSTRTPPIRASSSTMSARTPGRRSTSARPRRTTAGPCARGTAPMARPPTAARRPPG